MQRRALLSMLAGTPLWATATAPVAAARRVTAWCAEKREGAIAGLKATVEGKEAQILRVRGPAESLMLLVVLDVTGDLTLADAARQTAIAEIGKLPPSTWVGALRSQDGLRVLADPTPDRGSVSTAIQNAAVSGRAGLLETIEPAAQMASSLIRRTPVRVALLYITDSNIYNYREDYTNPVINASDQRDLSRRFPETLIREKTSKLAATLAEADAPVFITHLAFMRDRLNDAYQTGLTQMAEATGGRALFCRTQSDIAGTISQTFQQIRSMWAIDVEVPRGTPRNFTLQLSCNDCELQYRTRYTMASRGKE